MSSKFPGGFITKNYVAPTPAAAPGIWTLDQQLQAQKTGTWPLFQYTYIEDVFSTYLYTGTSAAQTITNGIDLAGKGGLVWIKARNDGTEPNVVQDTLNGTSKYLTTNTTDAATTNFSNITAFNSTGFNLGGAGRVNGSAYIFTSWTFRKQPKFFDVVTYTGDGTGAKTISHNLGSVPGCIIVKNTTATGDWYVKHTSLAAVGRLNLTNSFDRNSAIITNLTSTTFDVGFEAAANANGQTYVAYLFAHDAGGFGLTGTDNVISCGSYVGNGSATGPVTTLGYEPQLILVKSTTSPTDWLIIDNMRGLTVDNIDARLWPNLSTAEDTSGNLFKPLATGFQPESSSGAINGNGQTYIYIAIRRGPMKVPTDGTKVFAPVAYSTSSTSVVNSGFPTDMAIAYYRTASGNSGATSDRLRGSNVTLFTPSTGAEVAIAGWSNYNTSMSGVEVTAGSSWANGSNFIWWNFRRAPGFFDEVCYTGTGVTGQVINHNLSVTPEMVIIKGRDSTFNWFVYTPAVPSGKHMALNVTAAAINDGGPAFSLSSTTITFNRTYVDDLNTSAVNYVAYLFATCPGVSKVGSYTGTGATQTIACGFAAGARFVLIKRTDSTGDWYVWDTARGMVAGTDPKLALNTTAAESNANWVYTATTGFQIVTADASVNASGGTYIFLAIA